MQVLPPLQQLAYHHTASLTALPLLLSLQRVSLACQRFPYCGRAGAPHWLHWLHHSLHLQVRNSAIASAVLTAPATCTY